MRPLIACAALITASAAPLAAQIVDPLTAPKLGAAPRLKLPTPVNGVLANGLRYTLIEQHEVPLVQIRVRVEGGARRDGRIAGLATFTANMLDEGAGSRDALELAAEAEFLGAQLRTYGDWNAITVSLNTPKRTLDAAAALLADVTLRPAFRAAEVQRQRDLRLAAILQQRDQPGGMAALTFGKVMFPVEHPYHRPIDGDSASTMLLDSSVVRRFWASSFVPARTRVVLTGDLTANEAKALLQRQFGALHTAAATTPLLAPQTPRIAATTIFLVDKPGAAQSTIIIGQPGVARTAQDWAARDVMNTILGGSFSSRLNNTLREIKGYTYGASSEFDYQPLPGPWTASSDVRTDVTDSSLVDMMRELARIRDSLVPPVELDRAKQYLTLGLVGDFETTAQLADQLETVQTLGLPWSWFARYQAAIGAVSAAQVQQAARARIDPSRLTIVVVGDAAKLRAGLERLGIGAVRLVNLNGKSEAVQ